MNKFSVALAAALLLASARAGADVSVQADADRTSLTSADQIVLTVTVSGDQASVPEPKLPPMEDFSVYDSGRSQSISIVNGRIASQVAYTYVLSPRKTGRLTIPPISVDGASRPTAPIAVVVSAAGSAPAAAPPADQPSSDDDQPQAAPRPRGAAPAAMVVASVDRPHALVNQQITLTVRFLYSQDARLVGNQQYEAPDLTGFLTENLPPVRNGTTMIDGRPYAYSEIKTALFAIQPGRLVIAPATVHAQVLRPESDPFGSGFFGSLLTAPQTVALHSDPVVVRVDAPPAGKPADFTGVVGRLSAKAAADRTAVKAGEAVTLTVTVSGEGNMKSIPEPPKPNLSSARFFDTESSAQTTTVGDRVGGSKTFRTVLVPRVSGDMTIPSFRFPYFDPARRAYALAQTAPITLHVAPGDASAAAATATAPVSEAAPGVTAFGDDIRYLKTDSDAHRPSRALAAFADLGPWHAVPFLVLGAAALADWRRRAADADPQGRRFRDARRKAEERLKAVPALAETDPGGAAARVDEALAAFVADKLGVPAAGLTWKTAREGLRSLRRAPSDAALERLGSVWEEADLRRFAPGGGAPDEVRRFAEEVVTLIKQLDQEIAR